MPSKVTSLALRLMGTAAVLGLSVFFIVCGFYAPWPETTDRVALFVTQTILTSTGILLLVVEMRSMLIYLRRHQSPGGG